MAVRTDQLSDGTSLVWNNGGGYTQYDSSGSIISYGGGQIPYGTSIVSTNQPSASTPASNNSSEASYLKSTNNGLTSVGNGNYTNYERPTVESGVGSGSSAAPVVAPVLQPQQFNPDELIKKLSAQFQSQIASLQQSIPTNQTSPINIGNMFKKGTTLNQLNPYANTQYRNGYNGARVTNTGKQQAVSRYLANDIWKDKIKKAGGVSG